MLSNSPEFVLGFLPVALAGFFLLGRVGGQGWTLPWLAGCIGGNYLLGQRIRRLNRLAARRGDHVPP